MGARDDLLIDGPESGSVFVLAHGAGAPMDSPFMDRVARELAARDLRVVRFEFPYMQARRAGGTRRPPDRGPQLCAFWRRVIEHLGAENLIIGGKSMGGRIASMVADDAAVRGLVCLGYPFHPPGKPDRLRVAHLERLRTPALILHGTRDPFGTPEEIAGFALSDSIRVEFVEDGDHSFKPRKLSGRTLEQNLIAAIEQIAEFATQAQLGR